MKKLLFTFLIVSVIVFSSQHAHAAVINFAHTPTTIAQQQQFYVDVTVDPEGKSFNAIQGSIAFSDDTLKFVRAETGTSNVTLFIQRPTAKGNVITFSGIIPGGFDGLINPFDPNNKLPGQIVRLVFEGKAAGEAQIISTATTVADNDGQGTLEPVPDQQAFLSVSTSVAPALYTTADAQPPTLSASVVKENNLYNGKYTLLFSAIDKQSGLDHVEVKEGNGSWVTAESPYVLHDQSRRSILLVRAFDVAGNVSVVVTIPPLEQGSQLPMIILLVIFVLIVAYVIYKKRKQTI